MVQSLRVTSGKRLLSDEQYFLSFVAQEKRTHSAFSAYLVAFCSLQGMTFEAREDLEVTGLLLICFKPSFVLFCGFFYMHHTTISQRSIHVKHSKKFLSLSCSKSMEIHPMDLTEIFTSLFNLQNPIAGGHQQKSKRKEEDVDIVDLQ